MYRYYVSYWARNKKDQQGAGYAIVERREPIRTGDDVMKVSRDIKKDQKLASVTIMNWNSLEV